MATLFISDLHLDDERPEATELLLEFLRGDAASADALYILGDLFEYWLGDDVRTPTADRVASGLAGLADAGVPCYFMHGNRDFLLGDRYARCAGLALLPEEQVIDLYGRRTLLLHGDTLCTNDVPYQQVRARVRTRQWQESFLAKSPEQRIAFARNVRQESADYKQAASEEIMDVNPDTVAEAFARHGVDRMIHGHTHRPAIHDLYLENSAAQRIVLGDWYTQGSVLRVTHADAQLESLENPG